MSHQLTGCCACNTRRWRRTFLTWQLVVTGVHWWALTRTLAQPKSQFQQTDIRWHQSPVHVLFSFRPIWIYFVTLSHWCLDLCTLCNHFILLLRSAVLLLAEPGDLILWDSRTIHGGHVGTGAAEANDELARMSVTVCMVPRSRATTEATRYEMIHWYKQRHLSLSSFWVRSFLSVCINGIQFNSNNETWIYMIYLRP